MSNTHSDSFDIKKLEASGWKLRTLNFLSIAETLPQETEMLRTYIPEEGVVFDLIDIDLEDTREGLRTLEEYQEQGPEGFIAYSEYRRNRMK